MCTCYNGSDKYKYTIHVHTLYVTFCITLSTAETKQKSDLYVLYGKHPHNFLQWIDLTSPIQNINTSKHQQRRQIEIAGKFRSFPPAPLLLKWWYFTKPANLPNRGSDPNWVGNHDITEESFSRKDTSAHYTYTCLHICVHTWLEESHFKPSPSPTNFNFPTLFYIL